MIFTQEIKGYAAPEVRTKAASPEVVAGSAVPAAAPEAVEGFSAEGFVDNEEAKTGTRDIFISIGVGILALVIGFAFYFAYKRDINLFVSIFAGLVVIYSIMLVSIIVNQRKQYSDVLFKVYLGASITMLLVALGVTIAFAIRAARGMRGSSPAYERPASAAAAVAAVSGVSGPRQLESEYRSTVPDELLSYNEGKFNAEEYVRKPVTEEELRKDDGNYGEKEVEIDTPAEADAADAEADADADARDTADASDNAARERPREF